MRKPEDREMLRAKIAIALSRLVNDHGVIQKRLAEVVGCDPDTLRAWMRGESDIKAVDLLRICDALKVDPDEFLASIELETRKSETG